MSRPAERFATCLLAFAFFINQLNSRSSNNATATASAAPT
jgi:hypothetical protein